jgi:hypothetical protein
MVFGLYGCGPRKLGQEENFGEFWTILDRGGCFLKERID